MTDPPFVRFSGRGGDPLAATDVYRSFAGDAVRADVAASGGGVENLRATWSPGERAGFDSQVRRMRMRAHASMFSTIVEHDSQRWRTTNGLSVVSWGRIFPLCWEACKCACAV